MAITINGNGTVTGVSVGGLPDGIVDTDMLAATAVTDGKIANTTISEGKLAANVNTITEADQWRITTAWTGDSVSTLTSNWERNDTFSDKIGTGMSESSGIFTFPSTGIWGIDFSLYATSPNARTWIGGLAAVSVNSGGAYTTVTSAWHNTLGADGTNAGYVAPTMHANVDVTDVSTYRIKFQYGANASSSFNASSDQNNAYATFIRLGDT